MQICNPLSVLIVSLLAGVSASASSGTNEADTAVKIKKTLEARLPDVKVLEVRPSPIPHLYEVFTGQSIGYSDEKGEYLISGGALFNTESKHNLTQESFDAHNAIDFEILPLEHAIKIVKGEGRRKLAIFADPDCPYCKQLEQQLAAVSDVTIYLFLYPLADLHPQATDRARAIWCAPNPSEAWTQWMLEHKEPQPPAADCGTPLEENKLFGANLRIDGTPTLFLANGHRIAGVMATEKIEELLGKP